MKRMLLLVLFLFIFNPLFADEYKRIISLAPLVTDSIYELGLEENVIGITIFCNKGSTNKEIIGTLLEPDIEKIISLNPDLIIATKEGNNKAIVEKLIRLNFNVYVMETSENFKDICKNFNDLAAKLGKKSLGKSIIDKAYKDINKVYSNLKKAKNYKVFWEIGAMPLYTAGKQSFVNDYNYYTKTKNIYDNLNARYSLIDIEDVVLRNPDIIILVNMGDVTFEEINVWKKYKTLNAVKNKKILMIDVDDLFTPTPQSFAKGVKILAGKIYPEVFSEK